MGHTDEFNRVKNSASLSAEYFTRRRYFLVLSHSGKRISFARRPNATPKLKCLPAWAATCQILNIICMLIFFLCPSLLDINIKYSLSLTKCKFLDQLPFSEIYFHLLHLLHLHFHHIFLSTFPLEVLNRLFRNLNGTSDQQRSLLLYRFYQPMHI